MPIAYIALGSNVGDRRKNIEKALRQLHHPPRIRLKNVASLYQSNPIGDPRQPPYFNTVAKIQTGLPPLKLLDFLQSIEQRLHRVRTIKWGPRTLDLDLLTYGQRTLKSPRLKLPHPQYHRRRFVLVPFGELAPQLKHPRLRQTNRALLLQLTPQGQRVTMVASWKKLRFYPSRKRKN